MAGSALLAHMSVPDAYGMVEPGVYRSNGLSPHNLPFLLHLHLRTVLYLSTDPPLPYITDFLRDNSIAFLHIGYKFKKPTIAWKPVSEELIKDALEIVLDVNTHPIMIMCQTGVHVTGTVVGCLRRLQKWNLTSVLEEVAFAIVFSPNIYMNECLFATLSFEFSFHKRHWTQIGWLCAQYRRYAGSKARYANEQFMELFDGDMITLPASLPPWFIDQMNMMKDEEEEFQKELEKQRSGDDLQKRITGHAESDAGDGSILKDVAAVMPHDERQGRILTDDAYKLLTGHVEGGSNESKNGGAAIAALKEMKVDGGSLMIKRATEPPNYRRFFYTRSSPLTTENRSYKRKILGKVGS